MTQQQIVSIGMAELGALSQTGILRTTGLGSCVGVVLFDTQRKIGGLAHIMLPSSEIAREGTMNKAKYADTAVPELVRRMELLGASVKRLEAKLAGGAQMFMFNGIHDTMRIGPRNVESCKTCLQQYAIPIKAEDTGGNFGRTIELDCASGMLVVRSVQRGVKEL